MRFGDESEMEGEYVVMLGIIHTCTALRYKPAFIATRYLVSDCHARDPGSILGRDKRCSAFFHLLQYHKLKLPDKS